MDEIWKDIPGYEGLYQVSDRGRVKSLPRGKQYPYRRTHNNIRKQHIKNGYYQVNLSKNNQVKWVAVHRLVALAFIPNPDNLPQVNHKDENKLNNNVNNLEWCSNKFNCLYGTGIQRQIAARKRNDPLGLSHKRAIETRNKNNNPNSAKAVQQCDMLGNIIAVFESTSQAARETQISLSDISKCCRGLRKQAKGFYWRYDKV